MKRPTTTGCSKRPTSSTKKYAWTIPLALPVTAELAEDAQAGPESRADKPAGEIVATLDISDVFAWDKPQYIKSVYLTERTDHPGADMVLKAMPTRRISIGGKIRVLPQPKNAKFGKYVLSPARSAQAAGRARAGTGSSPSRPATRCTGPTNTPWCTGWRSCCATGTTPARASIR